MADEESDIYRNLFGDIIQSYEVYDFIPMKEPSYHSLTHTPEESIRDFLMNGFLRSSDVSSVRIPSSSSHYNPDLHFGHAFCI